MLRILVISLITSLLVTSVASLVVPGGLEFGATILSTALSDTIGTFRTNVNTSLDNLNAAITNTTSSLGNLASLASTTGNLIVGSSTQWTAITVGTNGTVLTASSTQLGGVSWRTVEQLVTLPLNHWTLSGTKLYASSTSYFVGIGTTTPAYSLTVIGSSSISNGLTVSSGLTLSSGKFGGAYSSASGTLTLAGQLHVATSTSATSTDGGFNYFDGVEERVLSPTFKFGISLQNATASEDIVLFTAERAFSIVRVDCVNKSAAGNTASINVRHGFSVTSTTDDLFTSYQNCVNSTSSQTFDSGFSDRAVASGEIIRFITSSTAALTSSTMVNLTIFSRYDP